MDSSYMDLISGQHETDSSLDCYLNPEKFHLQRTKGYHLSAYGMIKYFIVPKDLVAKSAPMTSIGINLKSHFKTDINLENPKTFFKTQDLETAAGSINLVHNDPHQIQKDVEFIRKIESRAFQLVLSEEIHDNVRIDENEIQKDIESLINDIKVYGTCLLVTEEIFENLNLVQVSIDNLNEIMGEFDCVIINLNKSIADEKDDEIVKLFLDIFSKVKFGGLIFIPETTYDFMPNSRHGAEALVKLLDFNIEIPMHKMNRMVIASKNSRKS